MFGVVSWLWKYKKKKKTRSNYFKTAILTTQRRGGRGKDEVDERKGRKIKKKGEKKEGKRNW